MKQSIGLPLLLVCLLPFLIACHMYQDETAEYKPNTDKSNRKAVFDPQLINRIGMRFVLIPAGTFMMGSSMMERGRDRDEKLHRVTLSHSFYMQTTEVTQDQWRVVMGNNPSHFSHCGGDCPVEKVSWHDVQRFIRRLNAKDEGNKYRLPTEAE